MLIINGLGAVADQQHQHCRTEEQYDGKVEVMNPTHQEGAARGENTAAGAKPELRQHSRETHHQTTYQAPKSTLWAKKKRCSMDSVSYMR